MDSNKVFAEMCKNCHGQDSIGGEVKEVEPVGVHDVTKEFRKGRAEPAVEEQGEKRVPSGLLIPGSGWEYLRARMRSRPRRPEEVEVLLQLFRLKPRREDCPLLLQRREPLRLGRLRLLGFRSHDGNGDGGRRLWWCWWRWGRGAALLRLWEEGEW